MKDIYSDTKAETIDKLTVVCLKLIRNADKKNKGLKRAFVTAYYNKESLKKAFIKYDRIISYLFDRCHRENQTPGNA